MKPRKGDMILVNNKEIAVIDTVYADESYEAYFFGRLGSAFVFQEIDQSQIVKIIYHLLENRT